MLSLGLKVKHLRHLRNLRSNTMTRVHQIHSEFLKLLTIYKSLSPVRVLEIGTSEGGSLKYFILNASPLTQFISIDLSPYDLSHLCKHLTGTQTLYILKKDSHNPVTLHRVRKLLNGYNLDFLFIDGDHSFNGVESDFSMYSPLVNEGLIVLHDIASHPPKYKCHVYPFWNMLKSYFKVYEIIDKKSQGWGGLGIVPVGKTMVAYMELLDQKGELDPCRTYPL